MELRDSPLTTARLVHAWMVDEQLSQAAAAARLRLPASWLRRFLAGGIRRLRAPTVHRIATALNVHDSVIELAVLSDEGRALAARIEALIATAQAAGNLALRREAATLVLRFRSLPPIKPEAASMSRAEWSTFGDGLTGPQKRAVLVLLKKR